MSRLKVGDLDVTFPFPHLYPEQRKYMGQLKLSFDANGPCVLEMPPGTGKSGALFAVILAYMEANRDVNKAVICVNSLAAMDRIIKDFKVVHEARLKLADTDFDRNLVAVPLLSKAASCSNESVLGQADVALECASMTLPWSAEPCPFFQDRVGELPKGALTIDEFRAFCNQEGECPYFLARRLVEQANVIFCTTRDLIDPRRGERLRGKLEGSNPIVVLDDASCIDEICCETLSRYVTKESLDKAREAVDEAKRVLKRARENEQGLLQQELERLRKNLTLEELAETAPVTLDVFRHPVVPSHRAKRPIPGSLRNPEVFLDKLSNVVSFFSKMLKQRNGAFEEKLMSSSELLTSIWQLIYVEPEILHFLGSRFAVFFITHQLTDVKKYMPLWSLLDLVAILSTYEDNIGIYVGQKPEKSSSPVRPNIQLGCHDASLAFSQIVSFNRFVLTGESISPLTIYSEMLKFQLEPTSIVAFKFKSMDRRHILPILVARGTDQSDLTSIYPVMENHNGVNNYGRLISGLAKVVPDGIVAFFPSFRFMQEMIEMWGESEMGVLQTILQHKLLFIETQDRNETSMMIDNHKRACDTGRGSVFFGVTSGRAVNGVDFSGRYGRCCVLFGLPDPQTTSPLVTARADFLDLKFQIRKDEFLVFNSVRHATQCCNKILNSKSDYAVTIFADMRYDRANVGVKLPKWIDKLITQSQRNQSVDDAIEQAKRFFMDMAGQHPSAAPAAETI